MPLAEPSISLFDDEEDLSPPQTEILIKAIDSNDIATTEDILSSHGATAFLEHSRSSWYIREALQQAAERDHHLLVECMLSRGIPFEMRYALSAIEKKSYKTMDVLLKHGWDINAPLGPMIPAPLAQTFHDRQLLQWFLSRGADPDAQTEFGYTPLSIAVAIAPLDIIELLIEHGGRLDHGELLHEASLRTLPDCTAVLEFLLEHGAEINRIKFSDNDFSFRWFQSAGLGTALQDAAREGNEQAVTYLLEQGADPQIPNTRGTLPIESARLNHHEATIRILEAAMAPEGTAD